MGYILRVIFVFNILHERVARVQYIENKNNEKNISHIARCRHAIIGLSHGSFSRQIFNKEREKVVRYTHFYKDISDVIYFSLSV